MLGPGSREKGMLTCAQVLFVQRAGRYSGEDQEVAHSVSSEEPGITPAIQPFMGPEGESQGPPADQGGEAPRARTHTQEGEESGRKVSLDHANPHIEGRAAHAYSHTHRKGLQGGPRTRIACAHAFLRVPVVTERPR